MIQNKISEKDKNFTELFSAFVNGKMTSPLNVGIELTHDHRYLIGEKAKIAFAFMEQLAVDYHRGYYDERNEWACRLSAAAIDHLVETNLYYPNIENYRQSKH